jgi:hypothetical protein
MIRLSVGPLNSPTLNFHFSPSPLEGGRRRAGFGTTLAGLQVVPARRFDNFPDARGLRERSILDRLTKLVPMLDHGIRNRVQAAPDILPRRQCLCPLI